jgi:hypothetical protein
MIVSVTLSDGPNDPPFRAVGENLMAIGRPRDERSLTLIVNAEPVGGRDATFPDGVKFREVAFMAGPDAQKVSLRVDGPVAKVLLRDGRHAIWLKRVVAQTDGTYKWNDYDLFVYELAAGEPTDEQAAAMPAMSEITSLLEAQRYAEMLPKIEAFLAPRRTGRTDQAVVIMTLKALTAKSEALGNGGDFRGAAAALDEVTAILTGIRPQANPGNTKWIDGWLEATADNRAQLEALIQRQGG